MENSTIELPKGVRRKSNGMIEEFFTLAQLAKACDRKARTLKVMEEKGQFPAANFRGDQVTLKDESLREGPRLYSRPLVLALVPVFREIRNGVKTPDSVLQKMRDAFAEEKKRFNL